MSTTNPAGDFFVQTLDPTATITTNSGHQGELRQAQISSKAAGLFMTMLSDVYTEPIEAVVREILTNGIDAHAVVGQRAPVILAAPTTANPSFAVIDQGVGMSETELGENFADYGDSLKIGEAVTIGHFGIGAKSIYAVTNQFTVTTTQSGVTLQALFTINEQGLPAHKIISSRFTDAPSGTTVTIPVDPDKIATWRDRITTVLHYVEPELVELTSPGAVGAAAPAGWHTPTEANTYPLERGQHVRQWLLEDLSTDEVGYVDPDGNINRRGGRRQVVMGNIGYALPDRLARRYGYHRIFFAPPSSLELSPTRETIKNTEHNMRVLDHLDQGWSRQLAGDLGQQVLARGDRLGKLLEIARLTRGLAPQTRSVLTGVVRKTDPALAADQVRLHHRWGNTVGHLADHLQVASAHYPYDGKREMGSYMRIAQLAHLISSAPSRWQGEQDTTTRRCILIDAGPAENLEKTSKMSRMTQAVKVARRSEPDIQLEVLVISKQALADAAQHSHDELVAALEQMEPSAETAAHNTAHRVTDGNSDTLTPERRQALLQTPLVDVDALDWVDMDEFLTQHKPPSPARAVRTARGPRLSKTASTREQLEALGLRAFFADPHRTRVPRRIPLTRAPELTPEQLDQLAATPQPVVVGTTAAEYERYGHVLDTMALGNGIAARQWLHEQIHAVPIVHRPRRNPAAITAATGVEVIDLEEHLRRISRRLLAGEDQAALTQLVISQRELGWAVQYYRNMLTDTRLPESLRQQVGDIIGPARMCEPDVLATVGALARPHREPGQPLTEAELAALPAHERGELPDHLQGDLVAQRWPQLAQIYRIVNAGPGSHGPDTELLQMVLARMGH